jgi:DNA end-binding protein Ku
VPVKAFTATVTGGGEISLNQIHAECNNRIQYKKFCPVHGEVKQDEIVSGYESAKGQYVLINPDELDKLRSESDKAIQIDTFIDPEALDPIYYGEKTYYLIPDGPVAQKPYAVIREGMEKENRYAVAQVVLHGKEKVVLLRPLDGLLTMNVLSYDAEIVKPETFESEVPKAEVSDEELKLAKTLIDASTAKKFDFSKYRNVYTEKLTQLIEAKIAGKELVAQPDQEPAQVINLMDALKQSVAKLQGAAPAAAAAEAKPPKKMAPSVKKAAGQKRKQA